jgi:hypothetical protein
MLIENKIYEITIAVFLPKISANAPVGTSKIMLAKPLMAVSKAI